MAINAVSITAMRLRQVSADQRRIVCRPDIWAGLTYLGEDWAHVEKVRSDSPGPNVLGLAELALFARCGVTEEGLMDRIGAGP